MRKVLVLTAFGVIILGTFAFCLPRVARVSKYKELLDGDVTGSLSHKPTVVNLTDFTCDEVWRIANIDLYSCGLLPTRLWIQKDSASGASWVIILFNDHVILISEPCTFALEQAAGRWQGHMSLREEDWTVQMRYSWFKEAFLTVPDALVDVATMQTDYFEKHRQLIC